MYETDGTLKRSAFSNTPPTKVPSGHLVEEDKENKVERRDGVPVNSKGHKSSVPMPLSPS